MATMNVSLPDAMKSWVEAQTRGGRTSDASPHRRDQERAVRIADLQKAIDDGLDSGVSDRPIREVVSEARTAAKRDHGL
jgi:antitoxin ParD1/3/4